MTCPSEPGPAYPSSGGGAGGGSGNEPCYPTTDSSLMHTTRTESRKPVQQRGSASADGSSRGDAVGGDGCSLPPVSSKERRKSRRSWWMRVPDIGTVILYMSRPCAATSYLRVNFNYDIPEGHSFQNLPSTFVAHIILSWKKRHQVSPKIKSELKSATAKATRIRFKAPGDLFLDCDLNKVPRSEPDQVQRHFHFQNH